MNEHNSKLIIHISEVDISEYSGMGRVEYHWKKAFERKGYKFIHIGPSETGPIKHLSEFPSKAFVYFKTFNFKPFAIIAHEPSAAAFMKLGFPVFLESHGIERRSWRMQLEGAIPGSLKPSLKSRLVFPLWRLRPCDIGLRKSHRLLLINSEDKAFVQKYYRRNADDIYVFMNGVNATQADMVKSDNDKNFTIVFNGTWILRKGIFTLIKAIELIKQRGIVINCLLIGTSRTNEEVLNDWPSELHAQVRNISRFKPEEETKLLSQGNVFVLPSFFEGQPLSLLQAMSSGMCCITSNCCGQRDIVKHAHNGLLFEPGDFTVLAELLEDCYKNRQMCLDLGKIARIEMKQRSWDYVSDELAEYVIQNAGQFKSRV